jgi:hypothetical protein
MLYRPVGADSTHVAIGMVTAMTYRHTKGARSRRIARGEPTTPVNLLERKKLKCGGEGGIRTHVPVTRQDAFEAPPLRPLRYLSGSSARGPHDPQGGLKTALYVRGGTSDYTSPRLSGLRPGQV